MRQAIEQWLLMLNTREKVMVFGGLGIAILLLFWGLVWEPLGTQHNKLETQIQERENELRWMHMAQSKIMQTQNNPQGVRPIAPANPSQIIDATLLKYRLKKGLKQMRGNNEISLALNNVNVDKVMQFLGELETRNGLRIIKMNITPLDKKGTVDASIKLGKG